MAAMRPLMVADPMLRGGSPEIVPASNFTGVCASSAAENKVVKMARIALFAFRPGHIEF
jgi:hypothetical protein